MSGHGKGGTLVGQVPWSVSAKRAQRQNGLGVARSLPTIGYSAIYIYIYISNIGIPCRGARSRGGKHPEKGHRPA